MGVASARLEALGRCLGGPGLGGETGVRFFLGGFLWSGWTGGGLPRRGRTTVMVVVLLMGGICGSAVAAA